MRLMVDVMNLARKIRGVFECTCKISTRPSIHSSMIQPSKGVRSLNHHIGKLLTVEIPRIKDVQPPLLKVFSISSRPEQSQGIPYQSEACQDRRIEAARMASEFAREKFPIASCNPLRAIPRW